MSHSQLAVAVAPELRFFLHRRARAADAIAVDRDGISSLGHIVESLGVPLTEVGSLIVNGGPATPSYRPGAGDVAQVLPMPRPQKLPVPRFVLDVHLGTVARRLRVVGVDTAYPHDRGDEALIDQANAQHRALLTQDRGLLRQHRLWLGAYVRGARPDEQFADVLDRFAPPLAPWSRCTVCNALLVPAPKGDVEPLLQPGTRRTYQAFAQCPGCSQVYWRGAHAGRLEGIVESAFRAVRAARAAHPAARL
ncbi:MAG TPA: Mut7-C RNAse domain-containing protein [Streptosporangiaceae bacterium]